jgi:hypothetical protein
MSKIDAISMGSAISFGRRYGLLAALGLTTDEADDNGRSTQKKAITDEAEESQKLWIIKSEISGCKTIEDLNQWADKAEKAGRLGMLEDHEMSLAQAAFSTKLKSFKDEAAKPEKK